MAQQGRKARSDRGLGRTQNLTRLIAEGDKVVAERFRTKMCHHFVEKGSCPYESRCMFAHGRHQLRTKHTNLRDGLVNEELIRQFKRGMSMNAKQRNAGRANVKVPFAAKDSLAKTTSNLRSPGSPAASPIAFSSKTYSILSLEKADTKVELAAVGILPELGALPVQPNGRDKTARCEPPGGMT